MAKSFKHNSGHTLPYLWQYMLGEDFLYLRLPSSAQANCKQCPQVTCAGFRADYRCCTYLPRIPNFQLALAWQDELTRPLVKKLIEERLLTPEGLIASPQNWFLSSKQNFSQQYGKGDAMLCPAFDKAHRGCGLHTYRNATCTSFFCYHDQGKAGEELWQSIENLSLQTETILSRWFLDQLGFDYETYDNELTKIAMDWRPDANLNTGPYPWNESQYEKLWDKFHQQEESFFTELGQLVLKHRLELRDIAAQQGLPQQAKYDQTMQEKIDLYLPDATSAAERVTSGRTARIDELWYEVQARHRNLWQLPLDLRLVQNPEATVIPSSDLAEPFRTQCQSQPYVLIPKDFKNVTLSLIVPLTKKLLALYQSFSAGQSISSIDWESLSIEPQNGQVFLSTLYQRRLLIEL